MFIIFLSIMQVEKFKLTDVDAEMTFAKNIVHVKEQWQLEDKQLGALGFNLLYATQNAAPGGMEFRYVILKRNDINIGLLYFQILPFQASDSLKNEEVAMPCENFFNSLYHYTKRYVASKVNFTTIVLGNLLLTSTAGFIFKEELDPMEQQKWISITIEYLFHHPILIKDASVCLVKDFNKGNRLSYLTTGYAQDFYEFKVQPGMRFFTRANWKLMEDYFEAIESKYRVKFRKAKKEAALLELRELNLDDIEKYRDDLYELYRNIANSVGFNMVNLNKDYVFEMKKKLEDSFNVFAYFLDGHPVAFFTGILNDKEYIAHYLGFDKSLNAKHKIYLNILLQLIEIGISKNVESIDFARTALEIKSSVGALEEELYCYVAHRSRWYNKFIPHILEFLKPEEPWVQRSPFKKLD